MKIKIFSLTFSLALSIAPGFGPDVLAAGLEADGAQPQDATPVEKPAGDIDKTVSEFTETPPRAARRASARPPYRRHRQVRVAVLNDISVATNEVVLDAVVVGGQAEIDGIVEGDLVVVGGQARLGPAAEVHGDLIMVGSILDADPAATISGDRVLVGSKQGPISLAWLRVPQQWFKNGLLYARPLPHQHAWAWIVSGVVVLLYFLLAGLFPRQVQASVNALEAQPGRVFLLGLLVFLLTGPVLLLLVATGIGVLLLPFILCAMAVVYLFGKVAVCRYAGQQIGAQLGFGFLQKPMVALLTGAVLFCLLYAIPVVGFLIWSALLVLGVGAVWKAMFKRSEVKPNGTVPSYTAPGALGIADPALASGVPPTPALLPRVGFWWRLLATCFDALLVGLLCRALQPKSWSWFPLFLLLWIIYHVALWALHGTTVGGILCGLKIVRSNGSPLNFGVALLRSLASSFSLVVLGLGFFWAGWSREKQSWHDKIADTIIVKLPKNAPVFAPPPSGLAPGAETK